MKKFQNFGKILTKDDQKKIIGGDFEGGGQLCKPLWTPCSFEQPGGTISGVCSGFCWCVATGAQHYGPECMAF